MILFLEPYFEEKPWAGNKLNKIYDCPNGTGEAWIVSGYHKKSSRIKNGIYKSESLRHLWMKHPELFGDLSEKEFPLLIKLIDAKEDLSVQVHPNDNYAVEKHNSLGKFECWFVLKENEAKTCIAGIDASKQLDVKNYIDSKILNEKLLSRNIEEGDLVVIEPGTVHALQAGSFVLEIQESSDITYRLYDYDREPKRELHIEDSLNVIRYNDTKNPVYQFDNSEVYDTKYFTLRNTQINGKEVISNNDVHIVYITEGEIVLNGFKIKQKEAFIICADEKKLEVEGNAKCIIVTPKKKEETRAKMRKIALITGIITQDGSYLADFLLEKGYEVHGLISSKAQLKSDRLTHLVSNEEIMNKQLFFHLGDMTDTSSLNRLLENIRPDEIYNLASQSHVYVSFEMPEYTAQVNSLGTLRLLDAIKQSDLRTRLFNESTSQIFGSCLDGEIQNENSPINPENPYATSKAYAHFIVKNYRKNYGLYAVNGIMFNRTSPREDEDFIAKKITKTIANIKLGKEKKLIVGNIDSKRDWGYSPDYIEGMWLSLQQDNPDDYIFATGETHSVKELIELSFKEIGISIKWQGEGLDTKGINALNGDLLVEISPELYRIDTRFSCGDSSLTKEKINWEHKVKFNKLVKLMIQDELNK